MTTDEEIHWNEVIKILKKDCCSHIHKFYSVEEGWANLAFKQMRYRITFKDSIPQILSILNILNNTH